VKQTKKELGWRKALVGDDASVHSAIEAIGAGAMQFCVVVDEKQRLKGVITDGDIRRAILQKIDIHETPAAEIMNKVPQVAKETASEAEMIASMQANHVRNLPIIGADRRVVSIAHLDSLVRPQETADNWVVIMAGGMGKRLRPLTEEIPKPLLSVGSKPLLETIVENFQRHNFGRFYFSVNYKAHLIREYFGDGGKWNAEIRYLEEKQKLGTAGALRLIEERPDHPIIVMNGDLLTRVNFGALLDFHLEAGGAATMCVREYDFQVPFGVVEMNQQHIQSIVEKPVQQFFVNAGIYVLNPELIDLIPENDYFDMTTLFEQLIESGQKASVFPINEYWLDVGRMDDLDMARLEYNDVFGS
jgi:dTDP-glucose pyrophosphorylase/CBS domain-containing protein